LKIFYTVKKIITILSILFIYNTTFGAKIYIPMDAKTQKNHLKAYGIAYFSLSKGIKVDWLLNYEGGSFCFDYYRELENECKIRDVSFDIIADAKYTLILNEIADPDANMDVIKLDKPPKICVYTPASKLPWDDAVTMVLTYAEIPFDKVYDDEVLDDKLIKYDWLHLHHEDFSGQYGKFWAAYNNADWYQADVKNNEAMAKKHGFAKVSILKGEVAKKIRNFVIGGGYLFAMCSATDSYDIAMASDGVDICNPQFDYDAIDADCQNKLDFNKCFAFKDFLLEKNASVYEFSNIDANTGRQVPMSSDYFTLFNFSAKFDPIPCMLNQNHTSTVKGFMGQTTSFKKQVIKSSTQILGETNAANEAKYVHGEMGKGTWTFYGGHDPEDYQHMVGDPKTDLALHPNSPGYRLILNNVLFPAAKKKPQKT
jgi:hypothetical protein